MQDKNRFALKEWAVVLKALSQGRQILLLRKGGLVEKNRGFSVRHSEFFIYPTYLHQQRNGIVPAWAAEMERILPAPPTETGVVLSHYTVVHDALRIDDLNRLQLLGDRHVLNAEEVRRRFFFGQTPGLHLILLRVFRLPEPFRLPLRPHYAGCRSWVDLERDLPTAGSRPVLDDDAFDREIGRIAELLKWPAAPGRSA